MKPGKTYQGIGQVGERERERVRKQIRGERSSVSGKGKWCGLIQMVGKVNT
jgi:hypothetical protein